MSLYFLAPQPFSTIRLLSSLFRLTPSLPNPLQLSLQDLSHPGAGLREHSKHGSYDAKMPKLHQIINLFLFCQSSNLYFDMVLIPEESRPEESCPKARFYKIDDVKLCLMYSSGCRS